MADRSAALEAVKPAAAVRAYQRIRELEREVAKERSRRRGEALRASAHITTASEAIVTTDGQGIIQVFNPAAEQIFRVSAKKAIGRHVSTLHADWKEIRETIRAALAQRRGSGPMLERIETWGRREDGELFPAEYSLARVEFGKSVLLTGFWRDISYRREAETALIAARDAAATANSAKSEFLATMSHEIRTPMNGVLGMAAALANTELTTAQRGMVETILDSGRMLLGLLSDVLDLSKIEAGRMTFEAIPFQPAGIARQVHTLYREQAHAKGLETILVVSPEAEALVTGDPTRVRQILQNFVANAIKFTSEGAVELRMDARKLSEAELELCISVTDTGPGIDSDAKERLFQQYSQADDSTNRTFGGTGLGLAICRRLIEGMGGQIGVDSDLGRGARFWCTLRLMRAEPVDTKPSEQIHAEARARPIKLLAAEDNATNRAVLHVLLSQMGVDVLFAENGAEAVEMAKVSPFDAILMDVRMPVMDGLTAARAIRNAPGPCREAPIIALTADVMPERIADCIQAGMNGHIPKPISPEILMRVLAQALDDYDKGQSKSSPASLQRIGR